MLGLSGLLADGQTPLAHAASHASGQPDQLDHNGLLNVAAGDVHTQYAALAGRAGDRLVMADDANVPPFQMTERNAGPAAPAAGDVYLDDGTNFDGGGGNPGFMRWTGAAWEDVCSTGGAATWTENDTIYVDPGGNDGNSGQDPANALLTIAQAITNATALTPTVSNQVVIRLSPGVWTENVTTADSYVHFVGAGRGVTQITHSGASDTFTVADANVHVEGITIIQTTGTDHAVVSTVASDGVEFKDCTIRQTAAAITPDQGEALRITGTGTWTLRNCIVEATADTNGKVINCATNAELLQLYDTEVTGWSDFDDGSLIAINSSFYATGLAATSGVVQLDGAVTDYYRFSGCTFGSTDSNGIYIDSDVIWSVVGSRFNIGTGGSHFSIQTGNSAWEGTVRGCPMSKGMAGKVSLIGEYYRLGTGAGHDYTETASDEFGVWTTNRISFSTVVADLFADVTVTTITIDEAIQLYLRGNGRTITTSTSINIWGANVIFDNLVITSSSNDKIDVYYNASKLELRHCKMNDAYIKLNSSLNASGLLVVKDCDLTGTTGNGTILIDHATCTIIVEDSTVRGAAGEPAVEFSKANTNFWAKNSIFLNGTGAADPMTSSVAGAQIHTHFCHSEIALDNAANITEQDGTGNVPNADVAGYPVASVL